MSVVHTTWTGAEYSDGLEGRRVMIVGNSHWLSENEDDTDRETIKVIENVVSGHWHDIAFFNHIRDYFGFSQHADFWRRVAFLNYAPWSIGLGHQRYAQLSGEMVPAAKERFGREVARLAPDLVFVFSKKIRWALPEMTLRDEMLPLPDSRVGTLPAAPSSRVLLLQHTQGAPKRKMIETISVGLGLPPLV
jgi:hypothetical protein